MEQNKNGMQVFAYGEQMVRTIERDDGTWWVLKDVCQSLLMDSTQLKKVADRLDADEKGRTAITTPGGKQETWIVNEPGLYSVILRSDKPEAKNFRRWITHEVLPQIRKTGSYGTSISEERLTQIIQQTAVAVATEVVKQLMPVMTSAIFAVKETVASTDASSVTAQHSPMQFAPFDLTPGARYKIDTFPSEVHEQIDSMLDQMAEAQSLNFLQISRFCTLAGHPLSSPAIREYYNRRKCKGDC